MGWDYPGMRSFADLRYYELEEFYIKKLTLCKLHGGSDVVESPGLNIFSDHQLTETQIIALSS